MPKIIATIREENISSRKVIEKAGFRLTEKERRREEILYVYTLLHCIAEAVAIEMIHGNSLCIPGNSGKGRCKSGLFEYN